MARPNSRLLLVLAGQLGLAAGFVTLGRVETHIITHMLTPEALALPDIWYHSAVRYGFPLPWADGDRSWNQARGIETRTWRPLNNLLVASAGLFALAFPLAIGLRRPGVKRWLWVAVCASCGGFTAAGIEAVTAGRVRPTELAAALSLPPSNSATARDLDNELDWLISWRFRLGVVVDRWTYPLATGVGLALGAITGCLIFRPWRRAGDPSASDGAAATTLPSA